ncbi:methyltransferase domain-containing protein [Candidatus Roizmanbacteria bacterium]|nr:methyltransferase domain-containing protein [Candidatus Roizmanbacteria bacterium]
MDPIRLKRQKYCRICKSKKLIPIFSIGKQFLADFSINTQKTQSFPLDLILCESCSLVQLAHTTPPHLLYTENYGYQSGINNSMQQELKNIVETTLKIQPLDKDDIAIDIGANDGTLLNCYPSSVTKIGFEPVKKFSKFPSNKKNIIISDFFNYKAFSKQLDNKFKEKQAKIITAISMFYDLEHPNEFIVDIVKLLDKKGVFVIQQNYLAEMIKQNAFDNIVHEHLEYYSLHSLEYLLKKHNLEVFDVLVNNTNGGSFRTYIGFIGEHKKNLKNLNAMRKNEEKMMLYKKEGYMSFVNKIKSIKKQLRAFIKKENKKGKKIYLYGASTRGNTLLQFCSLDNSHIAAAVERNSEKWGKMFVSVSIPIISEEQARKEKPDYMLVLPWFFKKEFLQREQEYLKQGGHFIFPLPEFEVI